MTVWRSIIAAAVLAAVCGCERSTPASSGASATNAPSAFVPRTKDTEYQKALRDVQKPRKSLAAKRMSVIAQMDELVARARAALPEGATEQQVRDELLGNPRKYPGWRSLVRRLELLNKDAEKELDDTRRQVATRIMKEQSDLSKRGGSK